MERFLTESIAKESESKIISKLDNHTKQYLKEHIQKSILEKYKYPHSEYLEEMINEAIEWFEDDLYAINYIKSIDYTIDDTYYKKLQEEYFDKDDDSICDWEDEYEKPKENIRLNQYTLTDFIDITYVDGIDLMVDEFYSADFWTQHKHRETYIQSIDESLKLHFNHNNKVSREQNEEIQIEDIKEKILNKAIEWFEDDLYTINYINIKEVSEPLSKRETTLITANVIFTLNQGFKLAYKKQIENNYNINSNAPKINQELLNNSYEAIINELDKLENTNDFIDLINNEKSSNSDLFTNAKKLSKLKSDNHYMSFLYKCSSVYTSYETIVFKEFTEALVSGYLQYLEFDNKENKIKGYKQDLEVIKRYNNSNENDENINKLEEIISFLSIPKPHYKFIPFKELSNRLDIDTNKIKNYIANVLNNSTHKNTIIKHFDTLQTIPKEICISSF